MTHVNLTSVYHYTQQPSALGDVVMAASNKGLVGCWFTGQAYFPNLSAWQRTDQHPVLACAIQQWSAFLRGDLKHFDIPLHIAWGTPFQQQVWHAIQKIPYGQVTTYGAIAHTVQRPSAVRAVGAAVGKNPLSLVIPCHRVKGANGSLTGYAGGLERKQSLLALESKHASS